MLPRVILSLFTSGHNNKYIPRASGPRTACSFDPIKGRELDHVSGGQDAEVVLVVAEERVSRALRCRIVVRARGLSWESRAGGGGESFGRQRERRRQGVGDIRRHTRQYRRDRFERRGVPTEKNGGRQRVLPAGSAWLWVGWRVRAVRGVT